MSFQPRPVPPGARLRNQRTAALIRRDILWQIGLPLGLALLLVIVIGVFFSSASGAAARPVWANISVIFLIIPTLLMGLVLLALFAALAVGMYFVLRELAYYAKRAQDIVALGAYRISMVAGRISDVILALRSWGAGLRRAAADVRSYLPGGKRR